MSKLLTFAEAPAALDGYRAAGKRIVQCHGTFDLVHPGHVIHFEEARALGDVLVVTITGEKHSNKGPGRPYFGDRLRVKMLSALEIVDHVIVIPFPAAVEAIECVRPDVYCKGREYEDQRSDVTGQIQADLDATARVGGVVRYVGAEVFSSTRLLNQFFEPYPPEVAAFAADVSRELTVDQFRALVDSFADVRVLVVGESIFDRYTTVAVQGLSSKSQILAGHYLEEDTQAGGSLAILRHLRQFTPHVKLVSLVGDEPWAGELLNRFVLPDEDQIVRAPEYTTIVKQRFVGPRVPGAEVAKLFSFNRIDSRPLSEALGARLRERLERLIDACDVVLVADFGHGLLDDALRALIQERAPFLALNCQTNSSNRGFNIINRQYRRADSFSLDETEIRLAAARRDLDFPSTLASLREQLGASYAWLTRGQHETIGQTRDGASAVCPTIERGVVDAVGAGDAFCAVATLAAVRRAPIRTATFLAQLAGAQAVKFVGNTESIRKERLLAAGLAMLKK